MNIDTISPSSILTHKAAYHNMHGRVFRGLLYGNATHQHMVLTTTEPEAQAVFQRTCGDNGVGKWEDLCIFPSEVEDDAREVLDEMINVIGYNGVDHLELVECHPEIDLSYAITRGHAKEHAALLNEGSAWAKKPSSYKGFDGKPFPTSTIRLVAINANGTVTDDSLVS